MRILLLQGIVIATGMLAACRPAETVSGQPDAEAMAVSAWQVDHSSRYFDYLSASVQRRASEDPHALAEAVCHDLGGGLASLTYRGDRFAANTVLCRFEEPGMKELVPVGRIVQR